MGRWTMQPAYWLFWLVVAKKINVWIQFHVAGQNVWAQITSMVFRNGKKTFNALMEREADNAKRKKFLAQLLWTNDRRRGVDSTDLPLQQVLRMRQPVASTSSAASLCYSVNVAEVQCISSDGRSLELDLFDPAVVRQNAWRRYGSHQEYHLPQVTDFLPKTDGHFTSKLHWELVPWM